MKLGSCHNDRIGGIGIYYNEIHFHHLQSCLYRQLNLALRNNNFPVEAYQRQIINHQVLRFQAQPVVQIRVHNLYSTALIHHHLLNIISPYPKGDHQGIII